MVQEPDHLPGVVATVIIADSVAVGGFVVAALVKLGGILNLVLCQIDVDLPSVGVEAIDGAGGQEHLLAEDPRPRIDHDVAGSDLIGRLIHCANPAVGTFYVIADEIDAALRCHARLLSIAPRVPVSGHVTLLSKVGVCPHALAGCLAPGGCGGGVVCISPGSRSIVPLRSAE